MSKSYKNRDWCEKNFKQYLAERDLVTLEKMTHVELSSLVADYKDEWDDFCTLEGVSL
jgi:hypothetical protein